jgi:hypothetical protein
VAAQISSPSAADFDAAFRHAERCAEAILLSTDCICYFAERARKPLSNDDLDDANRFLLIVELLGADREAAQAAIDRCRTDLAIQNDKLGKPKPAYQTRILDSASESLVVTASDLADFLGRGDEIAERRRKLSGRCECICLNGGPPSQWDIEALLADARFEMRQAKQALAVASLSSTLVGLPIGIPESVLKKLGTLDEMNGGRQVGYRRPARCQRRR